MYAVIRLNVALDELADAYVQADQPTRAVIEQAVIGFNARLAADPNNLGESRGGARRIAFDQPCAITFRVDFAAGEVRVTHFWTY